MKICLINNLYKPYIRGGAERIVELIAGGLQKAGHEVFIITTRPTLFRRGLASTRRAESREELKIYYLNALYYDLNRIPKILRLFWHLLDMFDLGCYWKVKSILKKERPDVVMTHNLKGIGYLIPKAIKSLSIRHIHTLHDIQLLHPSGLMIYGKESVVNSSVARLYAGICRWLFRSPDIVISPSNWLMKLHIDGGFFSKSRCAVVPNPVPTPGSPLPAPPLIFTPSNDSGRGGSPSEARAGGVFRFLYVGQIEEHKGILFLISTFNEFCKKQISGVRLIVVGDGSKESEAKKLAQGNSGIEIISYAREVEKSLMQSTSCLIVPSLCYENSPVVIYKAMACGLPVVASQIGGIPELINGAGITFTPNNKKDLISKMKWALDNKEKLEKISRQGKKMAGQWNINSYIQRLIKIL